MKNNVFLLFKDQLKMILLKLLPKNGNIDIRAINEHTPEAKRMLIHKPTGIPYFLL